MSRARAGLSVLALIFALGVQSVYVNPGVAAAELRAMACCAGHCDGPLSLPKSRDCCGLTVAASGPAESPTAPAPAPTMAITLLPPSSSLAAPAPDAARLDVVQLAGSGPPTFLAQRHLLL